MKNFSPAILAGLNAVKRRIRKSACEPLLRLGLLSDLHVCAEDADFGKFGNTEVFERALRWFDKEKVDGVVVAGDMCDNGLRTQLRKVGEAWYRVFPGNKGSGGRAVEKLFVYGNHDTDGQRYDGFEKRFDDGESFRRDWVATDLRLAWREAFREEYEPIWVKRLKGFQFVGAHWVPDRWDGTAAIEPWFMEHADMIDRERPFFYIQHPAPEGTCFGKDLWGHDAGYATRALSAFPNAVAISGHSHCTQTDDRFVWQGAFTSISLGSLRYGADANIRSAVGETPVVGGGSRWKTRQGALLTVWNPSTVTLECMDFERMEPLRAAVELAIPRHGPAGDGFRTLQAEAAAPEWPDGAALAVKKTDGDWTLEFPGAKCADGRRVLAYMVEGVLPDGRTLRRAVAPPNYDLAPSRVPRQVGAKLPLGDFLPGTKFTVRALGTFGNPGPVLA